MAKEKLSFYDVLKKTKFETDDYRIVTKKVKGGDRYFAVTKSPTGTHECWRVVGKDKAEEMMKA